MKPLCRILSPLLAVVLLSCPLPASAQHPTPRLTGTIHETARVALLGSHSPQTRAAEDLGELSPSTPIPGITLVFQRSAEQESALKELLEAQQDTASPLYRRWLTPEAFAARFGVADQDIAATEAWLADHGFHLDRISRARDRITFSGNAEQVQSAFGSPLHRYMLQGQEHIAPASDLTLPAELAAVTSAVLHLEDFRPRPSVRTPSRIHLDPNYTTLSTEAHYLGPKDVAVMYDLNPLYQSAGYGSGQGVAVVGQSYVATSSSSSVSNFQVNLGLSNPVSTVLVPGSGVDAIIPGDEGESELDLEYSSGIAQNANIFLVYVGDSQNYSVFDSLYFAIEENIAPVVSISYGACEPLVNQTFLAQSNLLFEQAAAQGQTIVASSGDSGSTACAPDTATGEATVAQQQALAVSFPADSPYVTAVGGTQMAAGTYAAGASSYWSPATAYGDANSSLLSYVPEVVWNENTLERDIIAGGGGTSAYFTRPAWQSALPGIPAGAYRLVPDISLQASIEAPGYLICTDDPYLRGSQSQTCTNGLQGSSSRYTTAGGTSFGAPIFAGFLAVLNQAQHTTGLGNINPTLYKLAANPTTYATAFHDITSGTNACTAGIGTCAAPGESGYTATTGYDEATGLGSVDFNALATAWPASAASSASLTSTVIILEGPTTAAAGDSITVQIYVDAFSQVAQTVSASGSVAISIDGVSTGKPLALTSDVGYPWQATGSYTFTAPATIGSHLVAVSYLGDTKFAPSTTTYSVLVGNPEASGGLTLAAANLSVATNGTGTTTVIVTPTSGYHGQVVWSLSASSIGTTALSGCYILDSLAVNAVSTAKLTFGVGTACDSALPDVRRHALTAHPRTIATKQSTAGRPSLPDLAVYAGLALCGLLAGRRRRALPRLLSALFATALICGLSGCGSGGTASTPSQPAATYTITLTGTDSVNTSISASTNFTLTVN